MTNPTGFALSREEIEASTERLLVTLGAGSMDSVPYDTAWIARLSSFFPGNGFDHATDWLRKNQREDGSWGGDLLHYHDRFISTLASIIALRMVGRGARDEKRVQRGEDYLWRELGRLHIDANETIAFPVLALSLVNEATAMGLDIPRDLYCDVTVVEKKLNLLSHDAQSWRQHTIFFSLEAAQAVIRPFLPDEPDFLQTNGSVAASPAATAAVLIHSRRVSEQAKNYLQTIVEQQQDGGAPNVAPIDTFEAAWSLNALRLSGAITPDNPEVQRLLKILWSAWSPTKGMTYSTYNSVSDLDCTATAFAVLRWGGYPVNADVFAGYELPTHFMCYPNETDPSLSAHVRMLAALHTAKDHPRHEAWQRKIMAVLRRWDLDGRFHFDKWHISPYYLRSMAMYALQGVGDDLAYPCIKWILKTQRPDGGWGYYDVSTLEETAYCLQALLHWDRAVERLEPAQIDAAAAFLSRNIHEEHLPPLWIGKCLYSPRNVVRSAALAAMHSYLAYRG